MLSTLQTAATRAFLVLALLGLMAAPALALNPASGTTTTGQSLDVEITEGAGTTPPVYVGDDPINVSASALLGNTPPISVNFAYVVDLSGSMEQTSANPYQDIFLPAGIGPEDDCNGDGIQGSALDSACFGFIALNQSLGNPLNVEVGVVGFGLGSVIADMGPATGQQDFTTPQADDDGLNGRDAEEVLASMDTNGSVLANTGFYTFDQVTLYGMNNGTNYEAALNAATALLGSMTAAPGEKNIVAFLSDGYPNQGNVNNGLTGLPANTIVHTFAVGGSVLTGCDPGKPLEVIATHTGGVCTLVPNPSALTTVLPQALATNIERFELFVNGYSAALWIGSDSVGVDFTDVNISGWIVEGPNTILATATSEDATVVTADTTLGAEILIIPVGIDIKPGSDPNSINLGSHGTVPVAILGSASFDASLVAPETVELAGATVAMRGKGNKLMASIEDVNGDGYLDMVVHVSTEALVISAGDTVAIVTGQLLDGTPFEGSDSIRIVPE